MSTTSPFLHPPRSPVPARLGQPANWCAASAARSARWASSMPVRVLRPAGDRLRLRHGHPRADRGRPEQPMALQGAASGARRYRDQPQFSSRDSRACSRPRTWGVSSASRRSGSRTTARQPDELLQGPRRRRRAEPPRESSASRCSPAPRPATSRTRSLPPRARAGIKTSCSSRAISSTKQVIASAIYRESSSRPRATTTTSTSSPARSPAKRGLGVRERQHAAVLRRGLEDAGLRDRRAARLAAAGADRHPGRVRLATHQGAQGLPGNSIKLGLVEDKPSRSSARRRPDVTRRRLLQGGLDVFRPVKPDTIAKSLAIGNPADGSTSSTSQGHRRRGRGRHRGRDPRGIGCSHAPRASSPRPPAASPWRCSRSSSRPASSIPTLETVVINTGHGLKTLDAVTDLVGPAATIAPTYDAFVAAGIA